MNSLIVAGLLGLGSQAYTTRDATYRTLQDLGPLGVYVAAHGLQHQDPEVRVRCTRLWDKGMGRVSYPATVCCLWTRLPDPVPDWLYGQVHQITGVRYDDDEGLLGQVWWVKMKVLESWGFEI